MMRLPCQECVGIPNSNPTEPLIIDDTFVEAVKLNDERCEMHIRSNAALSG